MKKLLIASTALVATSGFAMAQGVSVSGSAQMGVIYQEDRELPDGTSTIGSTQDDELYLDYELQFDFSGSTTTDSGLTFGASADFENDSNAFADSNDQGFDPEIFVSGGFGTLTIGDIDVATDTAFGGWTLDPGYDGIGIDNKIDTLIFADAAAGFDLSDDLKIDSNIRYEISAGGFNFVATADSFEENFAVAVDYEFAGGWRVGVGYVDIDSYSINCTSSCDDAAEGGDTWSIFAGGEVAGFDFNVYYADHDNDGQLGLLDKDLITPIVVDGFDATGYGLSAAYDLGGYSILFAANYVEFDDSDLDGWDYGIGVSYDLGGGAALQAGIGQIWTIKRTPITNEAVNDTDDALVASLGMTFSF